jgi:hypothetical protein
MADTAAHLVLNPLPARRQPALSPPREGLRPGADSHNAYTATLFALR